MSDDLPRPTPPPEANADLTTLRGYGYSDAQIASMSPGHLAREVAAIKAEDARRVQEAADAGYVPTPQEPAPAVPQPEIGTLAPKKRYWPSVALSCAVVVGFFVMVFDRSDNAIEPAAIAGWDDLAPCSDLASLVDEIRHLVPCFRALGGEDAGVSNVRQCRPMSALV